MISWIRPNTTMTTREASVEPLVRVVRTCVSSTTRSVVTRGSGSLTTAV